MARPRSFDEHKVLEQCREIFCMHGYDATSIDDLVAAAGLKRGSLYQAFGSKRGVFLKVLQGTLDATTTGSRVADKSETDGHDEIPAETTSVPDRSASTEKIIRAEPQSPTNNLFSKDVLNLVTIACLELAPHDAKVRDTIAQWQSLIPPEQAALLSQALGDNLLNRAGIVAGQTTDSINSIRIYPN
ncbi:TetR/AcrR family transcriptional regulator [Bifidobacterium sp. ESL0745]|uniref:TetR/AcrR family transcriptional regulator n=1 Tax=Bifidobacterium sp. ESL0745 TaxID=2983226 RepID=UPI0023F63FE8|nr:TetR/AcrR family transcriptional regulator [Bifidobacterium sp. ESL0745]MDF7665186.1 TetR/AcrR family transcriptional regulator [Bifidobacterium sp. ESL0745]